MRKLTFCTFMLITALGIAGCSKRNISLTVEEIKQDTIVVKEDGSLQVATVEDFDKDYYDLSELEEFIESQISTYNKAAGEDKISLKEVELHDGKAVMLLDYAGMEPYSSFNKVMAAYFSGGTGNVTLDLPATLVNVKNDSLASTEEIIKNQKYKVLVLYEPYEIIVDGKIKYYSEGAELTDDNKIKGAQEGITMVVFKP